MAWNGHYWNNETSQLGEYNKGNPTIFSPYTFYLSIHCQLSLGERIGLTIQDFQSLVSNTSGWNHIHNRFKRNSSLFQKKKEWLKPNRSHYYVPFELYIEGRAYCYLHCFLKCVRSNVTEIHQLLIIYSALEWACRLIVIPENGAQVFRKRRLTLVDLIFSR